jgi:2-dehydro-3-deoxy-D-gluconate 5-dehydrogenase
VRAELKQIGRPALVSARCDGSGSIGSGRGRGRTDPRRHRHSRQQCGNLALTGGVLNETADIWDNTIETHLNASFLLSQLVTKSMVKRKSGGKIINLASMYSIFGSGLVPSYSAAKGAIVQLTKSLAIELASHNIQVNAIAPGGIETDMTTAVRNSPMNDEILACTPAKRWGRSDEIIGAAVFLASRGADFITGVTLPVDGGYSVY